jgi:hypothetical protein
MVDAEYPEKDSAAFDRWACPSVHTSPSLGNFACLSAAESGTACLASPTFKPALPTPLGGLRQSITTFSPASRRRLLWLIAKLDETIVRNCLFLTLTYPQGDPSSKDHKKHLDTMTKRLIRKSKQASAIWKLEYTKKGTPHYHLLIFNLPRWNKTEIAAAWSGIVKSSNPNHEKAGTRIERPKIRAATIKYVTKYLSKGDHYPDSHQGRVWGKTGNISLALSTESIYLLSRETWAAMRRVFDNIRKARNRSRKWNRQASTYKAQKWFLHGSQVRKLMEWYKVDPKLIHIPNPAPT